MVFQFDNGAATLEIAALAALRCRSLQQYRWAPVRTHVERYWRVSKVRQYEWHAQLSAIRRRYEGRTVPLVHRARRLLPGLIEEILAGDVLTRVWSAVVPRIGRVSCADLTDFTQSALMGQLEARARAMQLLLDLPLLDPAGTARINQVRESTERWIDMLLGYLEPAGPIDTLACDLHRAQDFAATFRNSSLEQKRAAEHMLAEGISGAAQRIFQARCPHPRLNERIAHSVLVCLGPDLLDAVGPLAEIWQTRLVHAAVEMKYWLDKVECETVG